MKASEFCDLSGANRNDRFVIEKIYKGKDLDLKDWKGLIKKDFRSIDVDKIPDIDQESDTKKADKSNKQTVNKKA